MAWPEKSDVGLAVAQRLARGDAQLLAHQVEAGDLLGHRVLHLQAGVDLQEEELAGVVVEQQLHRARRDIADRLGQPHRGVSHGRSQAVVHRGRRRLLDDLLVAALDGALPLAEMDDAAVGVTQDLDFHMATARQVALQEHGVVAEPAERLAPGRGHRGLQVGGVRHQAHALAAAARGRLDHQREADPGRVGGILRRRQDGHPRVRSRRLGRQLVAHRLDGLRARADPHQARGGHRPGEAGVLGQEAVAGMDGVRSGGHRGGHHRLAVQIPARKPNSHVGLGHERLIGVGIGEHGHAARSHRPGRAEHPAGDLSPVGHQQRADTPHSRPRPELAAINAQNGTLRCQFPSSRQPPPELAAECTLSVHNAANSPQGPHPLPELAATNAQDGTQRCQFPSDALTAGTLRSPRRRGSAGCLLPTGTCPAPPGCRGGR